MKTGQILDSHPARDDEALRRVLEDASMGCWEGPREFLTSAGRDWIAGSSASESSSKRGARLRFADTWVKAEPRSPHALALLANVQALRNTCGQFVRVRRLLSAMVSLRQVVNGYVLRAGTTLARTPTLYDGPGRLLSCAVGEYARRLPGPGSSAAHVGHVHSVVTDPEHRRRGHARVCLSALVQWLVRHDCSHVRLRASPEGQPLYAGLGFDVMNDVHMVWGPPPSRPTS